MRLFRSILFLPALICALFLVAPAYAQSSAARGPQVVATLVALTDSIQPGKPFTVALKLEHKPHWHTYWINAGTGYPTSINWELPEGWTAGEIQWPVPSLIKDHEGSITGNGYEGVAYLPITITPPANLAPSTEITLKGTADWLMCADVCMPGDAPVSLTLPVQVDPPKPTALHNTVLASPPMPQAPEGWQIAAAHSADKKTVVLTLTPINSPATATPLTDPHFFSTDALIQYDLPQTIAKNGVAIALTLPVSESYEGDGKRLIGVLAFKDASGTYRGYSIDTAFDASVTTTAASNGVPASASTNASLTFGGLILAFLGGLILNLMPCVFPVLGIKILGFVNQAGASRRKVTMHGITFTLGVLVSFWVLVGILAVLRTSGDKLGWGYQLQSPAFVFCLAIVMLVFALSMSGVFEFGLSATSMGADLQSKSGYSGSFFTGVLATVVATPCSAPLLAPVLGAALALSTVESFVIFTVIALGLSTPYLLLSIFPKAVNLLPRPGAWMETFKQFMAFPLYATVAYLLWVLAGQVSDNGFLSLLAGLVVIAFAAWLYGRYAALGNSTKRRTFGIAGGIICLLIGGWVGWPTAPASSEIVWEKWSPAAVEQARASGKIVYVDFTARWCTTCQTNKKIVFRSDRVLKEFHDKKVVALKADWTNRNAEIANELAKWGRAAVPFNLVYKPGEKEPIILPEILTPGIVLDALK